MNFNIRNINGDSRCVRSGDVTLSQLSGCCNGNGVYILCDAQKVATIIKDKTNVESASQLDVLHLSDTSNKDCEFIGNYYGYSQREVAQLIDFSYPLITISVDLGLENISTINEIKRLEDNFIVSVTDGHSVSFIIAQFKSNNFISITSPAENVQSVDLWNNTQILDVKHCNDSKDKNNYNVSRLYIIEMLEHRIHRCNSCISRFLDTVIEACNWCIICLSICEMIDFMVAVQNTMVEMTTKSRKIKSTFRIAYHIQDV